MAKEEKGDSKWEEECGKKWEKKKWRGQSNGMFGFFYCVAFIGVAVYYIQQTQGFWPGVLGVLKALVWPAFFIHRVFTLLGM
jgi:hypothetical protein